MADKPPLLNDKEANYAVTDAEMAKYSGWDEVQRARQRESDIKWFNEQRESDASYYKEKIKELQREIQKLADELKQADKNYIALKNEFDTRVQAQREDYWKHQNAGAPDATDK